MIAKPAFLHAILVVCSIAVIASCGDDDSGAKAETNKPSGDTKHEPKPIDAGVPDASGTETTPDATVDAMAMQSEPTGAPTFGAVFDEVITGSGCNGGPLCHGGSAGMLKMDARETAYKALVGVKAKGMNLADTTGANCADTDLVRVVPGDPQHSLLMQKLDPPGGMVPCGSAMPPTGMLKAAQIEQIRTWIESGAHDD